MTTKENKRLKELTEELKTIASQIGVRKLRNESSLALSNKFYKVTKEHRALWLKENDIKFPRKYKAIFQKDTKIKTAYAK